MDITKPIAHGDILDNSKYRHYRLPPDCGDCYNRSMKLRLKELRVNRGWTQVFVADKASMSQSYYTDIENGKKTVNARRMETLAQVFGVTPQELIVDPKNAKDTALLDKINQLSAAKFQIVSDLVDSLQQENNK